MLYYNILQYNIHYSAPDSKCFKHTQTFLRSAQNLRRLKVYTSKVSEALAKLYTYIYIYIYIYIYVERERER